MKIKFLNIGVIILVKLMIPIGEFVKMGSRKSIPCQCCNCNSIFYVQKHYIDAVLAGKMKSTFNFCSRKCLGKYNHIRQSTKVKCTHCGKDFCMRNSQYNRSKTHFCSKSCSTTYHNLHKTKGFRRSKFEIYIEYELTKYYPNLAILFNDKKTINSELDVYIPSLKLAFEFNGIFHYEPIYGEQKLKQIQNNDNRKFQACSEQGISLCMVDISNISYFKKEKCQGILKILYRIIKEQQSVVCPN